MTSATLPTGVTRDVAIEVANVSEDPVLFSKRVLRHNAWSKGRELLEAVATKRMIAVKGCHGSSKTFTMADAALWWLQRWDDATVIVTGPTETQIKMQFWKELKTAREGALLRYPEVGETKLTISDANWAMIRAAAKGGQGVRFQGAHGSHLLIIGDEAPGIPPEIYEAIHGARAGGHVVVVLLGNPTVPGGPFYDAFTSERTRWYTITISALDTPNLRGLDLDEIEAMPDHEDGPLDANPWPMLITRRYVREAIELWGRTNHRFESRVLGQFPQQAEGALIPLAWLEAAKWREITRSNKRLSSGIDVAEAGESETVLYVVDHGHVVAPPTCSMAADARGAIAAGLRPWKLEMGVVRYDKIGVGAYFGPALRDLGYSVSGVNVGLPSSKKEFVLLKDQLYWELREAFRSGSIAGLLDDATIAQLASIQYGHRKDGKIQVESKKDMAKRGVKSPDRAEAFMLANSAVMRAGPGSVPLAGMTQSILERNLSLG